MAKKIFRREKLRALTKFYGFSHKELCEKVDIAMSTLDGYLGGGRGQCPRTVILFRLCDLFHVPMEYWFNDEKRIFINEIEV